jgi:hypothetical protein
MTEQPDKLSLANRIGISSHVAPADYEELAALALREEFPVFEIATAEHRPIGTHQMAKSIRQ